MDEVFKRMDADAEKIDWQEPWKSPEAQRLDRMSVKDWLDDQTDLTPLVKRACDLQIASDNGVELAQQSYLGMLAAIKGLTTARHSAESPDPARFVPMAVFEATVAELNGKTADVLTREQAEFVVDRAIGKREIPPSLRDWAISLSMHNRGDFEAFVGKVGSHVVSFLGTLTAPDQKMIALAARDAKQGAGGPATDEIARNLGLTDAALKTYGSKRT